MRYSVFFFFTILTFTSCGAREIEGTVVNVADGDTFTLLTPQRKKVVVRLHGIDAPEKGQDFYQVSRQYLSDLLMHQRVIVKIQNRDRYGRTVGIVFRGELNANEAMLSAGLAWHYKQYDKSKHWTTLEEQASSKKRGLWSMSNPQPPWEFRKQKRQSQKARTLRSHVLPSSLPEKAQSAWGRVGTHV